ncbi:hypothetical protein CJF32_00008183 [Rutstroemia sp. NJR-2017a WRK4]|nr:hypothetical protein CJF32_00008183 [Rutstroemia sp. NJR-2017a WRK4]
MAFYEAATQWHIGEEEMHARLRVPQQDNPTSPFLAPYAANLLVRSPLLAIGTLDASGRPWTTLWGGEPGFSWPVAQSVIAVKTTVDREFDPVVEILLGKDANGTVQQETTDNGRMVGGLAIDLQARRRVKLYGRMAAGALKETSGKDVAEASLVVKIEQSLGNCPKYLNKKRIVPRIPSPQLVSTTIPIPDKAADLITRSDLFFISSSNHDKDMDTNHRGGPPGFVRILSNDADGLFVADGLSFRGIEGEFSPYNPPVRYLTSENTRGVQENTRQVHAKLIDKKILTPTVGRFRFHIPDPDQANRWKPGQYVALSFKEELDIGYSHMRDDDPKSLNDDYIRTFTVSSPKDPKGAHDQFEITIRKVGVATDFLFRHNPRVELELPLNGFGGEFFVEQGSGEEVSFVAGGVGITPLLAQAPDLDLQRLKLYWTVRSADLGLVKDTFEKIPGLASSTKLFVTGGKIGPSESTEIEELEKMGAVVQKRRMGKDDIAGDGASKWYLCTGTSFRDSLVGWLDGKQVHYEDFNY